MKFLYIESVVIKLIFFSVPSSSSETLLTVSGTSVCVCVRVLSFPRMASDAKHMVSERKMLWNYFFLNNNFHYHIITLNKSNKFLRSSFFCNDLIGILNSFIHWNNYGEKSCEKNTCSCMNGSGWWPFFVLPLCCKGYVYHHDVDQYVIIACIDESMRVNSWKKKQNKYYQTNMKVEWRDWQAN